MNKTGFTEIRLPIYWASYIANGDESGLEEGEKELVDSTLEHLELTRSYCADVKEDISFELPPSYLSELLAGDYCTYVFYEL